MEKKSDMMKKWAAEFREMADKQCCRAGAKSRGAKLNCLPEPEPKLRIAAQAPVSFYLAKTFREKIVVAGSFCKLLQF